MNVIVTGASLTNKGAESMLLITVNAVKESFPDSDVYFLTCRDYDEEKYNFKKLWVSPLSIKIANGESEGKTEKKLIIWEMIKSFIFRRPYDGSKYLQLEKVLKKTDLILDVSGFAIGNKWNQKKHIVYITNIKLAQKYKIPIYLLPQSFGPFDYSADSNMEPIKSQLAQVLRYPKIIFAREQEGFDQLRECFGLSNVKLSYDLVLQNRNFNPANVFTSNPELQIPRAEGEKVVGIVPNKHCFIHGDQKKCLDIYKAVISQLIADGYTVVLFRHSSEDLQFCQLIKDEFKDNAQVVSETKEFSSLEYNEYVKQFDFIVCSRYHGIVHAYRNNIPCLALGWAVKYQELTKAVGQEKYFFDITDSKVDILSLSAVLKDMENNCVVNKKIIEEHLTEIQKNNCFDLIWDDFTKKDKKNCSTKPDISREGHKYVKEQSADQNNKISENNKKIIDRFMQRYDKYSFGTGGYAYPEQYEAVITKRYHSIEKGLSYINYTPGFGKNNVNALLKHMNQYAKTGDITAGFYETALSVLYEYIEKNKQFGCEDPDLESKIKNLPGKPNDRGGVLSFRPLTFEESSSCNYKVLMENRHSIRHFSEDDVDIDVLHKAIQLAQNTPSACNRQGWKTRIISSREIIKKVLDNQNGNSGFGDEINKLLVITSDLKYFNKQRETFQAFIDGGMYAMSVINSLSYYGIAHIPLSASLTPDQEENVRNIIGCDDSEVFILFIGTGCYPDVCQTTRSERKIVSPEVI